MENPETKFPVVLQSQELAQTLVAHNEDTSVNKSQLSEFSEASNFATFLREISLRVQEVIAWIGKKIDVILVAGKSPHLVIAGGAMRAFSGAVSNTTFFDWWTEYPKYRIDRSLSGKARCTPDKLAYNGALQSFCQ